MSRLLPLAALAVTLPASAQQFWTVDDDGPADFATLQAAVNAVGDGDVIVVRPGAYGLVVIDGKGLTLISEVPGGASIQVALAPLPNLEIKNLASHQAVHVRGFTTLAIGGAEQETVVLADCAGPVLLEDCDINGFGEPLIVRACASATLVDCTLVAPRTFASFSLFSFFGFATYAGLVATDSSLFLYDCEVRGSNGGASSSTGFLTIPPGPSAAGIVLRGSTLLASGCTLGGGSGGDAVVGCFTGEDGSAGLQLTAGARNPSSTARLLDCTLTGGTGGAGTCGLAAGLDAPTRSIAPGSQALDLPGSARSFRVTSPVQGGGPLGMGLNGEPGDVALLHYSVAAGNGLYLAPFSIAFHLQLPLGVLALGTVPAGGVLSLGLPVPPLPGLEGVRFVGQSLFIGGTGLFDGGPSTIVVLGGAL